VTAAERARIARKSVVVAGCVLLGFLVAGEFLLSELGIRLVSFQVAGSETSATFCCFLPVTGA